MPRLDRPMSLMASRLAAAQFRRNPRPPPVVKYGRGRGGAEKRADALLGGREGVDPEEARDLLQDKHEGRLRSQAAGPAQMLR